MSVRKPDSRLDHVIAELQRMRTEDRNAVIDLLKPADRLKVERLLKGDAMPVQPIPPEPSARFAPTGYSSWLLTRLEASVPDAMTDAAARLLRECALEIQNTTVPTAKPSSIRPRRLAALLRPGKHSA